MSLAPHTQPPVAERPLLNLRDLADVSPADPDGRIRTGLLYRSAGPHNLAADAAATLLDELGVALILDLRSDLERSARPWPELPAGVRVHPLAIAPTASTSTPVWPDPFGPVELGRWYAALAVQNAADLAAAVHLLAAPDCPPTLIHCTAGKDRTGIVVAALLELLGATPESITADYTRTEDALPAIRATNGIAVPGLDHTTMPAVLLQAPAEAMHTCLTELHATHDGFTGLLTDNGVTEQHRAALRERLLAAGYEG
ncbi:tyrosine-protein phosphatase [Embleya sp. AB8]|uniref:tyrosine-protein phosphatase n=1 Tax=Embleya sp. AB8 TaxID=3156304 RepID=UPI003C74FC4D